jgi:hypothetical protein
VGNRRQVGSPEHQIRYVGRQPPDAFDGTFAVHRILVVRERQRHRVSRRLQHCGQLTDSVRLRPCGFTGHAEDDVRPIELVRQSHCSLQAGVVPDLDAACRQDSEAGAGDTLVVGAAVQCRFAEEISLAENEWRVGGCDGELVHIRLGRENQVGIRVP